jgi:hypothetical protein
MALTPGEGFEDNPDGSFVISHLSLLRYRADEFPLPKEKNVSDAYHDNHKTCLAPSVRGSHRTACRMAELESRFSGAVAPRAVRVRHEESPGC